MKARKPIIIAGVVALLLVSTAGAAFAKNRNLTPPEKIAVNTSKPVVINGQSVLATNCDGSQLEPHTGFQIAPACVKTADGEVSDTAHNPQLLITDSPDSVKPGKDFTIKVSTRNLVRDRFLGAAAGGYYLETSLLTADGLQRGHFHTACRVLDQGDNVAPVPSNVPAFFVATEDGKGGAKPDTVSIKVPGKDPITGKNTFSAGQLVQCAAWAGDGSHRVPMMQFAKETPAFDAVRLKVRW